MLDLHKKVLLKTYGCQMNIHDSERILALLKQSGYAATEQSDDADVILFNTCAIRDHANAKFYSHLGETRELKMRNPHLIIGTGGCIGQLEGEELLKRYPQLDFTFGPDVIDEIPQMIERAQDHGERFSNGKRLHKEEEFTTRTQFAHASPQAFVTIMKGCDNFCSFCIVPFARGREKSRLIAEIVEDVRTLVRDQGIQEITLLGQNVNAFGKGNGDQETLANLIRQLEPIEGLEIIRYTSSHPRDITDDLIEVHRTSKKLANHLHLPVQSGSNSMLARMNRNHTIEHYLERLQKLRAANPALVISTDIICGFPNETGPEHRATLELLEQAQFDFIYSYAFSPRPLTKAAQIEDQLTQAERMQRLYEVQALQNIIQLQIRHRLVGQRFIVLVDSMDKKTESKWSGRTNCMRIVHFEPEHPGQNLQWHWVEVEITSATAHSCQGRLIQDLGTRSKA